MPAVKTSNRSNAPLRLLQKTITFDGATGSGEIGNITVATLTGRVRIERVAGFCTTSLVGATATIKLGSASNTAAFIAATTATAIEANDWWTDASPSAGHTGDNIETSTDTVSQYAKYLSGNLTAEVETADITAGVLEIYIWWEPITSDGALA